MPKISIIIPCYKHARYLPEAVASLRAQTHRDWEALIVNDGSPDDTRGVSQELAAQDARVRYLEQENRGLAAARNLGLAHFTGDHVVFLDADDWLEPEYLEKQLEAAARQPANTLTVSRWREAYPGQPPAEMEGRRPPVAPGAALDWLLAGNTVPVHCWLVPRAVVEKVGTFDEALASHEDWDYWLRTALAGFAIAPAPGAWACYRKLPESMSADRMRMMRTCWQVLAKTAPRVQARDSGSGRRRVLRMYQDWTYGAMKRREPAIWLARRCAWAVWRRAPLSLYSYRLVLWSWLGQRARWLDPNKGQEGLRAVRP